MFFKKKEKEEKKKRIIDKVIMGAVIGGAVGSVLGVSMAPKKEEPKTKTNFFKKIIGKIKKTSKDEEQVKIPNEME